MYVYIYIYIYRVCKALSPLNSADTSPCQPPSWPVFWHSAWEASVRRKTWDKSKASRVGGLGFGVWVWGLVQGLGFRAAVRRTARIIKVWGLGFWGWGLGLQFEE